MENLMEYLISKNNKGRVNSSYTKSMLKTGDIVKAKDDAYFYVVLQDDLPSVFRKAPFLYDSISTYSSIDDYIIGTNGYKVYSIRLSMFKESLQYSELAHNRYSIIDVYPGDPIKVTDEKDVSFDTLQEIAKKRKRISTLYGKQNS